MATWNVLSGDCRKLLRDLKQRGVLFDSVVCDPPYHLQTARRFAKTSIDDDNITGHNARTRATPQSRLSRGFMGMSWDGGDIAFDVNTWRCVFDVLKPGAHLLAFGGSRTSHRVACAIEDAGFEIRDTVYWMYGTGFPKSLDVSKAIDKAAGAERKIIRRTPTKVGVFAHSGTGTPQNIQDYEHVVSAPATPEAEQWEGWGTALKPAVEPIILARKPFNGTVASNVLKHGTSAINIKACEIPDNGRYPANLATDGSEEVEEAFARYGDRPGMQRSTLRRGATTGRGIGFLSTSVGHDVIAGYSDEGSAMRFFKEAKWSDEELEYMNARDVELFLSLESEHVASVLSGAVVLTTGRLALDLPSYRARSMNVTASELNAIYECVIALMNHIVRKSSQGSTPESTSVQLDRVRCVATPKQTGITTITVSLSKSDHFVDVVTFNTIATNSDRGASGYDRMYYMAKATDDDRKWSRHPTVKPLELMHWLVRMVTPPGGIVLDPFAGSGTTLQAAVEQGFSAIGCEITPEYVSDIERRMLTFCAMYNRRDPFKMERRAVK